MKFNYYVTQLRARPVPGAQNRKEVSGSGRLFVHLCFTVRSCIPRGIFGVAKCVLHRSQSHRVWVKSRRDRIHVTVFLPFAPNSPSVDSDLLELSQRGHNFSIGFARPWGSRVRCVSLRQRVCSIGKGHYLGARICGTFASRMFNAPI